MKEALDAGANVIVAGSAVFKGNAGENTRELMEILKNYELDSDFEWGNA